MRTERKDTILAALTEALAGLGDIADDQITDQQKTAYRLVKEAVDSLDKAGMFEDDFE